MANNEDIVRRRDAALPRGVANAYPGAPAAIRRVPVSTKHQEQVEWARHSETSATIERERYLVALLSDPDVTAEGFTRAFLGPPLRATHYERDHGTLYTAIYRPRRKDVEYLWPGKRWRFSFARFREAREIVLRVAPPA